MKVSLIIPTYKREEVLVDCLKGALLQEGVDYEVIVVDQTQNHLPETKAYLESVSDKIIYHYSEIKGLTRARNTGFRLSSGEILVFIDDDTILKPDFLSHHLAAHRAGYDVVGGRVLEDGSPLNDRPTWITPWLKYHGGNNCPTDGPTNTITGCNFSVSRKVYEAVGGFDENFHGRATREDSDFGYGAYKKGFKVWYSSKAELFHRKIPTGGVRSDVDFTPYFDFSHNYCELLFCKKHFSWWVQPLYKIRLKSRSYKAVRHLLRKADTEVRSLPS